MAQATIIDTNLRLVFETGLDEKGEPIYKNKTYSNIKQDAAVDKLLQAAQALGALCSNPLYTIERNDRADIIA